MIITERTIRQVEALLEQTEIIRVNCEKFSKSMYYDFQGCPRELERAITRWRHDLYLLPFRVCRVSPGMYALLGVYHEEDRYFYCKFSSDEGGDVNDKLVAIPFHLYMVTKVAIKLGLKNSPRSQDDIRTIGDAATTVQDNLKMLRDNLVLQREVEHENLNVAGGSESSRRGQVSPSRAAHYREDYSVIWIDDEELLPSPAQLLFIRETHRVSPAAITWGTISDNVGKSWSYAKASAVFRGNRDGPKLWQELIDFSERGRYRLKRSLLLRQEVRPAHDSQDGDE